MNKVVRREILAGDLPASVRGDIDPTHRVEIVVRDLDGGVVPSGRFTRFFAAGRSTYGSADEIVAHVRQIRDGDGMSGAD
ncbi:hypothetical protein [Chthonobacter rhizosphaerae]|uniref:hypothetical protein n=1 Tax=Chthonobacter rhizosphaerae TaxID=2735553 RepID=UPI0015EEB7F1|nr:hypothetical protein [Chthonobacter rhizosphaerae]